MEAKNNLNDVGIFFKNRGPKTLNELSPLVRKIDDSRNVDILKALVGAGFSFNEEWIKKGVVRSQRGSTSSSLYFEGCIATGPSGIKEPVRDVIERLNKPTDVIKKVDITKYSVNKVDVDENGVVVWKIVGTVDSKTWMLEAKLALTDSDFDSIIPLLEAYVPCGTRDEKTVSLQADSHIAGDCWVGLIASYDDKRIPFVPISADIGCGMCLVPMISKQPGSNNIKQLNVNNIKVENLEKLKAKVCYRSRKVLARGKVVELGNNNNFAIEDAITFIGGGLDELRDWADLFGALLEDLEIPITKTQSEVILFSTLTKKQNTIISYVMRFGMTLGSSGNHFLEMNVDENGNLYLVVHSGSRALGAIIYNKISALCNVIYGDSAVATGWLAEIYNRAFSVLNKFAVLNRLSCAIAVLNDLGLECNGSILRNYLITTNPLFHQAKPEDVSTLLKGVTHNGIKCFVNHADRKKIFVLGKGAIAISARSSCGIVALRAGEGVYVMTFINPKAKWVEHDLGNLHEINTYKTIYDFNRTDIILMGHGAGRNGSATSTWKNSEYLSMLDYFNDRGIWANLSPNVLGDNPEKAYKSVDDVVKHLPIKLAATSGMLRTLVNHKEGIDPRPHFQLKFAQFILDGWDQFTPQVKLMCDLVLVTNQLVKAKSRKWLDDALAEQESIFNTLYRSSPMDYYC